MRIWYSVNGEGRGHAFRSDALIAELLRRGHDVKITAAEVAYDVLRPQYKERVERIEGARFLYRKNAVRLWASLGVLLLRLPVMAVRNLITGWRLLRTWQPDIIVTDFEPTASYTALFSSRPVICLDNNHEFVRCVAKGWRPAFWAKLGLRLWIPRADLYAITSFCGARSRDRKTRIIRPIVREEVTRRRRGRDEGFVLVYQTSESNERLPETLAQTGLAFRVYGMGRTDHVGKVTFRPFSRKGFLNDLERCSWVLVNGGFTVISEALALQKPVFAVPIRRQEEQQYNARMLRNKKYGDFAQVPTTQDILSFQERLGTFRKHLASYPPETEINEVADLIEVYKAKAPHRCRSQSS